MNLNERRNKLIQEINNISDEQTLKMLEESLAYYTHADNRDITDGLDKYQLKELTSLVKEPSEKDTISEEEFRKLFSKWSTK
jgi:hypothetical protein